MLLLRLGNPAHRSSQLTRVWILAGRIGLVWHRLPGQVALSAASCESFATAGAWFAAVVPPKTHFSHEAVGGNRHGNGSSGGRGKGDPA